METSSSESDFEYNVMHEFNDYAKENQKLFEFLEEDTNYETLPSNESFTSEDPSSHSKKRNTSNKKSKRE